jgi:predicted nucleic acid-binding protein
MVFDTMIIAYALLNVDDVSEKAQKCLEKASKIYAPELLRSELTNVMWQYVKKEMCTISDAIFALNRIETLIEWIAINHIWEFALKLSVEYDHPPYDTMFIAASHLKNTKLITRDKTLHKKFSDITTSMEEFLQ